MADDRDREHQREMSRAAARISGLLAAVARSRLVATRLRGAARLADHQADTLGYNVADAERDLVRLEAEEPDKEPAPGPPKT